KLLAQHWQPGVVDKMLKRAGADMSRPEGLDSSLGMSTQGYRLSETQAQAILDLRLHRLTGLEQEKIITEYGDILTRIDELLEILENDDRLMQIIRDEIKDIRERYGDDRRTEIVHDAQDLTTEDLIAEEDLVVTLSRSGYVKAQALDEYRAQRRGGRGKSATQMKQEDFVDTLFVANSHDTMLCFSNRGKVYWLKVYRLPQAGRAARGRPIINLLPLEEGEVVTAVLPVREFEDDKYVFMCVSDGTVKKTGLGEFSRPRASGIIAVDLRDGNRLISVGLTDGSRDILLFSDGGKVIRFPESEVRPMGRSARGVRGIALKGDQQVISMIIASSAKLGSTAAVLTATDRGYGKRTELTDYPAHRRGAQGVISIQVNERNGKVVGTELVDNDNEIMLITTGGTLIRTRVEEISTQGRNTQGVKLIDLGAAETLVGMEKIQEPD
ncbi:MAG TPA: DNA gyrase subunit A, partial [Acidiferrobacteraceae bacterium]|nr:DNA gyrase subunit A [Acidiferrobacteraceae bacterium]